MPGEDINTTLRFNADITDFKAAMQEANRLSKLANSEFKAVSSGMDDWSSSTDGLTAKLKQLSAVQQAEERKLDVLRAAYNKVAQEQGENSAAAVDLRTKINNQQAAVNKAAGECNKFANKLEEVESGASGAATDLKKAGNAAEEAGEQAEDSGEGWTIIKDVIADMCKNAIDWAVESFKELMTASADALAQLGASTGASTEKLKEYEGVMKDIYRNNYGESFEDISAAMGTAVQMFGELDNASLQNITQKAITLRDTFDMDYTESMRAVNSLMDQFGITADEAFNLIAQGAQNGLNQNGDLLDVVNEYSMQFKTAGYSADDMFNMLKNGADTGTWSVDKLGDAVKEFNIRAKDGTAADALVEYQKQLGLSDAQVKQLSEDMAAGGEKGQSAYKTILDALGNVGSETDRYKAGVALFGTQWEDLGEKTVQSLMNTKGEISSAKTAMEDMRNVKFDTLSSAIDGLGRIIQSDLLQPVADALAPVVKGFIEWVIENMPILEPIIAGVATALGVLAAALAIAGLIKGISAAFAVLNAVLLANPIVLIVAAIAGLVAAFVTLWNKCDGFREFFQKLWEGIQNAVSVAVDWIVNAFNSCVAWVKELPSKIKNAISSAITFVKDWGAKIYNTAKEKISSMISGVVSWLKELPGKMWSAIVGAVSRVAEWGANVYNAAKEKISSMISGVVSWLKELPGKMWSAIVGAVSKVTQWGANVYNAAKTKISSMISGVVSWLKELPGKMWSAIVGAVSRVVEWGSNLVAKGKQAAQNLVTSIVNGVKSLPSKMLSVGKNLVQGLWNGISNSFTWIKNKVKEWVGNVLDFIKGLFGIHSPSTETEWQGEMLVAGYVNALTKGKKKVAAAMKGLATSTLNAPDINVGAPAASGKTIIFNQTNNSPRALTRREIYRQTHNALAYAGGA